MSILSIVTFDNKKYYFNHSYITNKMIVFLAEWWKSDTEAVINEALKSGLAPNVSDAHTINGHPGPVSKCPTTGQFQNSLFMTSH